MLSLYMYMLQDGETAFGSATKFKKTDCLETMKLHMSGKMCCDHHQTYMFIFRVKGKIHNNLKTVIKDKSVKMKEVLLLC